MKKTLCAAVASALFAGPALALDVDMELSCPATKRAGEQLVARIHIENEECDALEFDRKVVALFGNTNGSVGGLGIFGPFARGGRGTETVPAATGDCPFFGSIPGILDTAVVVVSALPQELKGTVASIVVSIDLKGSGPSTSEGNASASCEVNVL